MPQSALFRLIPISRARLSVAVGLVLAIVLGIGVLAIDVLRQIEQESESRSDNAQWALSQIELELMHLISAADSAEHAEIPLSELRLRYDIFYSRLTTLQEGRVFSHLRETQEFKSAIQRLSDYMQRHVAFIDGPDTALRGDLLRLRDEGHERVADARNIALTGVEVSAAISDQQRAMVTRTLFLTGLLTAVLFAFLMVLLFLLLRLFRFSRLRAAQNLATLSRLDAVVSTAMEALITVDARGRIVDFNDAASQTFGQARAEAVGTDMASLIAAESGGASPFRPGAEPDVAGQGRYQVTARRRDGQLFPAEVAVSRMTSGDERLFVVFLRDLSAQVAAEQALVAARDRALAGEKAKAELLAVMSHEIRTPLNGMIGTIELLDATALSPQQREYLRILQASGRLLMHHVNDVLDITRLDSGKASLAIGPVDLTELVQEVIENQLPTARVNGNAILFQPPADGRTRTMTDGAQLRQVLLNLVGNAVKFTRDGTITVEIDAPDAAGMTEIRVRDTGIGIAEADRDRIFDDFVTLDASYARDASGTGLGLGIVRRIVAQMGGELSLESQPGKGSTFRIRLPLPPLQAGESPARVAPPAPQVTPPPAAATGGLAVLVVEDNEFNRVILREMLRQQGHDVVEAHDGAEGIALAQSRRFDLILMDISMPQKDGLQATKEIRAGQGASRAAPILAMTAHALKEETERFLAGGMTAVLTKPVTREALARALQAPPPAPAPPAAPPLAFDPEVAEQIAADLGPDRARTLLQRFRSEAEETVAGLIAQLGRDAVADAATITRAHRLAGASAMFGASALHGLLCELETAWKTGAALDAPSMAERLSQVWQATRTALPA